MNRTCRARFFSLFFAAGLLLASGGFASGAEVAVGVPAPTGDPSPNNDYNCTFVSDAGGQPLNPGDTVTLSSSSPISSVEGPQNTGASAGAPAQLDNGGSSVDIKIGPGIDHVVVHYKNGKRRCVFLIAQAKTVTIKSRAISANGTFSISYQVQYVDGTMSTVGTSYFANWGPPAKPVPAAPAGPGIKDND